MFQVTLVILLALTISIDATSLNPVIRVFKCTTLITWVKNPFKFMVLLSGNKSCTGSVYDSKTVISSAQCFEEQLRKPNVVNLEFISREANSNATIDIHNSFIPPAYTSSSTMCSRGGDDISVVRLERTIDFNLFHHHVLTLSNSLPAIGTIVIVVSYVSDKSTGNDNEHLLKEKLTVSECQLENQDKQICATASESSDSLHISEADAGAPIIDPQSSLHLTYGFKSGCILYKDGKTANVFAPYKRHEHFIRNCIVGNQ